MKKLGFGLWLGLCLPLAVATAQAAPIPLLHFPLAMPSTPPTFEWFTQRMDHFDPNNQQTFQQRFVIDSSLAADDDAPVVFYVCGEGNCIDELSPNGLQWHLAEELGAHFVALEHRYYGDSLPFPSFTAETFKYLSVEQAIEDLASFEKWVVTNRNLTGKWLAIGGSYPADLAAIYRLKHPELAAGAIASSACAHYDESGNQPDTVAAQTAGPECVSKYRAQILDPIVAALGDAQKMAELKKIYDASDISDDVDFVGALTGMAIFDIQETGANGFCAALDDETDPRAAFAAHLKKFIGAWGTHIVDWSYTGMASTQGSKYRGALGTRQWMYQACTQIGRFTGTVMRANPDPSKSLSTPLTDTLPPKYCGLYFGLQAPPVIDEMNQRYYAPLLDPSTSNILFVNGSNDPACFPFSISKENGNDTNPNTQTYTVDGGSHCQDLNPPREDDSESLQGARDLELQLAHEWTN